LFSLFVVQPGYDSSAAWHWQNSAPRLKDRRLRNALGIDSIVQRLTPAALAQWARAAGATLRRKNNMNLTVVSIGPVVALVAGILILIMPRLLNYIVAIYLIIIGVLGLAAYI
jgi:Protein of unknown function (DUF3096)